MIHLSLKKLTLNCASKIIQKQVTIYTPKMQVFT